MRKALQEAADAAGISRKEQKTFKADGVRDRLTELKGREQEVPLVRNVDGSQNGVRHAFMAIENSRTNGEVRFYESIEQRLNNRQGEESWST